MDENTILDHLEELIEKFGVHIRHEAIRQDEDSIHVTGGLCLLQGEYVLIINSKAAIKDRIWTLGIALKQFDYDQIYIRPVLRDILEKIPEQRRLGAPFLKKERVSHTGQREEKQGVPPRRI